MRIFQLLHHLYIIEFNIEVLVDRFQGSANLDIVLELDGDFVVDQGLEEAICRNFVNIERLMLKSRTSHAYLKNNILRDPGFLRIGVILLRSYSTAREFGGGWWGYLELCVWPEAEIFGVLKLIDICSI
jgi:hypothetical protein